MGYTPAGRTFLEPAGAIEEENVEPRHLLDSLPVVGGDGHDAAWE
jgi:hypothetical protein